MNSSSPRVRNITVVLSTIAAIALAFVGYYYFYVQNQERTLDARNQRVLTQIRNNVIAKNKTYIQNAVNNSPKDIDQLKKRVIELVNEDIRKEKEVRMSGFINQLVQEFVPGANLENPAMAVLRQNPTPVLTGQTREYFGPNSRVEFSRERRGFLIEPGPNQVWLSFEEWARRSNRLNQLQYAIAPSDTFHAIPSIELVQVQDTMAAYPPWRVNYSVWVKESDGLSGDEYYQITMSIGLPQFLQPLERSDIFDGMILVRQKQEQELRDLIYSSVDNPRIVNFLVSESDRLSRFESNDSTRLGPLNDLPFRLYSTEMVFQGSNLMLIGLVEKGSFEQERLGISTVAVITLSVIAILVLLAFPLMKLVLMGNYERLSLSDLLLAVMSAILGTFIITQLIIDGYGFNGPDRKRRSQQLVELSNELVGSMTDELRLIREQLTEVDTREFGAEGAKDQTLVWRDTALAPSLEIYPYFQSIYWVDSRYHLTKEWTSKPELAPKIVLSDRKYLTGLEAGNGWRLRSDGDSLPPFRLESLLAKTTGEQLAVVSIPSIGGMTSSGPRTAAVFLTTQLRSLHNPVLPPGFGFAIIGEKGKVWFHSDARRNLQENFLEETDEPSLLAAIENNAELRISGSYLGADHEFFVRPLSGMPLYLISFRETNIYRSTHAQILSMTFFLILAAFITGLSFILVQILVNPRSPLLKNDQFTFDWLRPDRNRKKAYRELILINLANLALAMILSPLFQHGLPVLCMIGLLYIYTFILAFLKLNRNTHQEFQWEEHRRIVITTGALLIVSNIFFVTFIGLPEYGILFWFQVIPFLFLVREIGSILSQDKLPGKNLVERYGPNENDISFARKSFFWIIGFLDTPLKAYGKSLEKFLARTLPRDLYHFFNSKMSFRLFLLSWLTILSVFPVIRFYEFSYNQENRRLIKYGQIQLFDQFERHIQQDFKWWKDHAGYLEGMAIDGPSSFADRPLREAGVYSKPFFNSVLRSASENHVSTNQDLVTISPLSGLPTSRSYSIDTVGKERELPAYTVFDSVLSFVRPYYTDQARKTHRLPRNENGNSSISWDEFEVFPADKNSGLNKLSSFVKRVIKLEKEEQGSVTTDLPYYRSPFLNGSLTGSIVVFYATFIAFVLLVYYLIKFVIRKFFALDFVEQVDPDPLATAEAMSEIRRHLFITIPPRSMVRDYLGLIENREDIADYLAAGHSREDYHFDLRKDQAWEKLQQIANGQHTESLPPALIIDQLEHRALGTESCSILLGIIDLLLDTGPTIILVCAFTPVDLQERMADVMVGDEDNQQKRDQAEDECSRVLGEFTRIDYPLPDWEDITYAEVEKGMEDWKVLIPESRSAEKSFGEIARFIFLTPAILKHESKSLTDKVAGKKGGTEKLLFESIGFECTSASGQKYELSWTSKDKDDFLLDDFATADQVRAVIDRIREEQTSEHPVVINIFSSLAPQELIQLLLRDQEANDAYIEQWDRFIHRFRLIEFVREFRRIDSAERVSEIIREECMHDPFLQGLQHYMRKHLSLLETRLAQRLESGKKAGTRRMREAVIVEIEQQAHLYYQALWNNCSEEERYLIYDLAQDGLVNTHNRSGINNLVRKGIIRRGSDNLELLNHSFRNFVLTAVNEQEALMMERKIRREGAWNRIRIPITLILLAFGIFIFYFQANWFDETLGLVTALAAVIPAFNSLFERLASFRIPGLNIFEGMFRKK